MSSKQTHADKRKYLGMNSTQLKSQMDILLSGLHLNIHKVSNINPSYAPKTYEQLINPFPYLKYCTLSLSINIAFEYEEKMKRKLKASVLGVQKKSKSSKLFDFLINFSLLNAQDTKALNILTSKVNSVGSGKVRRSSLNFCSTLRSKNIPVVLSFNTAKLMATLIADSLDRAPIGIVTNSQPLIDTQVFTRPRNLKPSIGKNHLFENILTREPIICLGESMQYKKENKDNRLEQNKDNKMQKEGQKIYLSSIFLSLIFKSSLDKVKAYAVKSQMGKIITKPNKPNQDSFFIIKNPMGIENGYLFGVMDGHGLFGKEASSLVKNRLPENLSAIHNGHLRNDFLLDSKFRENLIKSAYERTNEELNRATFNVSCSGTTSVTVFTHDSLLLCANVGDSRAVIALVEDENVPQWEVQQISVDHKPNLLQEYQRILMHNGRVEGIRGKVKEER